MKRTMISVHWVVLVVLVLSFFAIGARGLAVGAASPKSVTLHLSWYISSPDIPFFYALEKGYYKEAGLKVKLEPGQGSFDTIKVTGAGQAEFGYADAATMSKGVSEGIPVIMVAVLFRKSPMAVMALEGSGITKPKDLEGRSIGMAAFESTAKVFPAFAKKAGFDHKKVKFVPLSFATKIPSLLTGRVDSMGGYILAEYANVSMKSKQRVILFKFSDYGINMYSHGLIVTNDYRRKSPNVIKAFVKASMKGAKGAIENRDQALDILKKHVRGNDEFLSRILDAALSLIRIPKTERQVYGWMERNIWETTQELMLRYGGQKNRIALDKLYTNEFLQ